MSIIGSSGKRYSEFKFANEKELEDEVSRTSKLLFGKNTIYINAKKKIESKSLGGSVPDGFFFDFSDSTDPQFYIAEVELAGHSFYNHIFPQITKFFAFFKNTKMQKSLVDKLFSVINTDEGLRNEFKKHLGSLEIYKFLSDVVESSQNILLVVDGPIHELTEIMDTYTDTWGKMVKHIEIRKYTSDSEAIYTITPDFETLQYVEASTEPDVEEIGEEEQKYSEEYHLEGVGPNVKEAYSAIQSIAAATDPTLIFNPQKYYISIKAKKNIAFLKIRNKKIRLIAMMPDGDIRKIIKTYSVASLSQPVQDFYNGPCAAVDISNLNGIEEIKQLIHALVEYHLKRMLDS